MVGYETCFSVQTRGKPAQNAGTAGGGGQACGTADVGDTTGQPTGNTVMLTLTKV